MMGGMESLRGHLLVASPALIEPNFRRTVVLVGEHNEEGAVGVVLNRATDARVVEAVPPLAQLAEEEDRLYVGGPVQPDSAVVIAEFDSPDAAELLVFDSIGFLIGDVDAESAGGVRRARVFAGYAGWGPGQLEAELALSSWIVERAVLEDVFTAAPDRLWNAVLLRKGGRYRLYAFMPPDPSAN